MVITAPQPSRKLVALASFAFLVLASCGTRDKAPSSAPSSAPEARLTDRRAAALDAVPACGTGAHDRHAASGVACATCHPCGGTFGFATIQYPGGTTTAGGQITLNGTSTTCAVGCHNPLGATPQTIAWNAGPITCTTCHNNVATGTTLRSSHFAGNTQPSSAECQACHDNSRHTSGQITLVLGTPSNPESACTTCHGGNGLTIGGRTPPLLVGWTDSVNGDFHGSRSGTGYGGTLKAPYVRGQAPLSCTACHDPHSSKNSFLFAATVNGTPIPAGAIDRTGVGAEVLCNACHQGDRHAQCKSCHTAVVVDMGNENFWFDQTAPRVDPAPPGSACFYCHGHEGIVQWTQPGSITDNMLSGWNNSCIHCHQFGMPDVEYSAPILVSAWGTQQVRVDVTATTATFTWITNEWSTSEVEWGLTTANHITSGAAGVQHQVTVTGLTGGTTYAYRVRSSDDFRNVLESSIASFTTSLVGAPPAPTVLHTPDIYVFDEWATFTMRWNAVTVPDHDAVQYRMVLDEDGTFTNPVIDTGWISATSYTDDLPLSLIHQGPTYYWRVMARDAGHTNLVSPWSVADSFRAYGDY